MMHRTALRAVGFCLLAGAIVGRPGSAVAFADGEVLQPGVTAEFELAVGAMRRHAVTLEAGQLLHVEVREKGPRVLLALLDGNGSVLARRQALFFELTTLRLLANLSVFLQGPVGVAIYVLPRAWAVPLVFVRFGYFLVALGLVGWIFGPARAGARAGVTTVGAASGSGARV